MCADDCDGRVVGEPAAAGTMKFLLLLFFLTAEAQSSQRVILCVLCAFAVKIIHAAHLPLVEFHFSGQRY